MNTGVRREPISLPRTRFHCHYLDNVGETAPHPSPCTDRAFGWLWEPGCDGQTPALQELIFRWGEHMGGLLPSSGTSAATPAV